MRHLSYFLAAAALATAVITGCSSSTPVSSDSGTPDGPVADTGKPTKDGGKGKDGMTGKDSPSGMDSPVVGMDSPITMMDSPVTMPETSTDGPCNFATFVLGLIANDTTATATPSANLGQSCTDDQKQSEFSTLFP